MSNLALQFTAWPEMLAWPYLILNGWLPYKDIVIAHNPLLLLDLVIFFKLFGVGILQLKIYTWLLISLNCYLSFYVAKRYWDTKIAYVSTILYLILCLVYQGNGLWFDLALTPFALLLFHFLKSKKYVWVGVIFALGFLTKQTFIYFAIPAGIAIVQSTKYRIQSIKLFSIGVAIIMSIFLAILYFFGILDDYYNWAIKFGIFYLPRAAGQVSLPNLKQFAFAIFPFLVAVLSTEYLVLSFAIVGALGVYPRWELFHFQPALPFLAIALASFFFSNKTFLIKFLVFSLLSVFMFIGIYEIQLRYRNLGESTRFFESDVQKVVSTLVTRNPKPNNLYIVNYWDNIYPLTNTFPNKPLIPYIPWYLNYADSKEKILNSLKLKMTEQVIIGERDSVFPELYEFVDNFYTCKIIQGKIEVCDKN